LVLSEPLRRINIACHNSLIVTLATCEGAYLATAAAEMPFAAAPFCGIVGPSKPVSSFLLIHGFRAFYSELVQAQNFVTALHQLQQRSLPEYTALDTAELFRNGRQKYLAEMLHPSVVRERTKRILRKRARYGIREPGGGRKSRRATAREILNSGPRLDAMWEHFIMADIFPENRVRFASLGPGA
jgi:hypothetical protein